MEGIINNKELELYRGILTDLNDGKSLSYNQLVEQLLINFGIKTTIKELIQFDEPTFVDEQVDLKLQYKHLF